MSIIQHQSSSGDPNCPQVFTDEEAEHIRLKLSRKLGPEYVSRRSGPGGSSVTYIEAWKVIELANEVFGFNGWSSSIQSIHVDYVDETFDNHRPKYSVGLSVILRITLKDGTFHEDIGYGSIDNCRGKAIAFEKCKKEGTTDALKRALRTFGSSMGNCLYDRNYTQAISRMTPQKKTFDRESLMRPPSVSYPSNRTNYPRTNATSSSNTSSNTNMSPYTKQASAPSPQKPITNRNVPSNVSTNHAQKLPINTNEQKHESAVTTNAAPPPMHNTHPRKRSDTEIYADEDLDTLLLEEAQLEDVGSPKPEEFESILKAMEEFEQ
ncbi:Rad22 Rti1 [Schizosaccharomyces japonicus yFS275]|uniref:Rad22 Rti1 n=1 Tax=Schizosaccharomyces japonicus (strain yFS275 / FY16936) TaxID=402676 RepID=B6K726_SCHJY|nr:Rad22 Rti1 [Schizosaccharomyces japonicus yFS275]EEB09330.1 Rad22 Rti1 [Schizosaccharomyces japonicus yFS275]